MGKPYVRREAQLKAEVLQIVERSPLPVRQTLQELQIAPSTYYRWKSRYRDKGFNGLVDRPPEPRRVWNRLATKQRWYVVRYALEHPSLSPREVATTLVDEQVMYVSESTVYRILKEAGLIKPPETKGFPAGKEFHTKTARPNELWQTDASYFFVVGWGYYYLISVLGDYSRMIVGLQGADQHEQCRHHRGGPGCGGVHRSTDGACRARSSPSERQRSRLSV